MQAEHRAGVADSQRGAGDVVDVRAVGLFEPAGREGVGEQPGVDVLGAAGAVLVELDLQQGRLGGTAQPGHHPRVRVGLLELVDGPVREQLEQAAPPARPVQVREYVRGVVVRAQVEQRLRDVSAAVPPRERCVDGGVGALAQRGLEPLLDLTP